MFTIFFIGLLIPSDNEQLLSGSSDASASPFVIAIQLAGVKVLPDIINAVLLSVVLSAANSNVYSGARILLGLAESGTAPKVLMRTNKHGVPYVAVVATSCVGFLAFLNMSNNAATVFDWLLNISAVAGFICWSSISLSHIRFMKALQARGIDRRTLPYRAAMQPWYAYYGLFFTVLIMLTQGFTAFMPWSTSEFFVAYISLILFVVLFVGHKMWSMDWRVIKPEEVDIKTGCVEYDTEVWEEKVPTTWYGKTWDMLVC